ncbi:hypothetical protein N9B31_06610 [Mariniblastus sp.]|nr:hypothetical protein [Mariniblastus sp.]MDB4368204.1 hypothetical protein [Mariniblastus sp.]
MEVPSTNKSHEDGRKNHQPIVERSLLQLRRLVPVLCLVYVPILILLAALVAIYLVTDIPLRWFFIDPVAEFNSPMYIGSVSNLGVLLWGAAASVCIFGGWLAFNCKNQHETAWFLLCAGLVSMVLMLDDLFLLHEEVIEDHLFIPQQFVFAAYGVMVMVLIVRYRKTILESDYMLLFLAFVFFSISVGVDLFVEPEEFVIFGSFPGRHIIEDGFKLLGIASWSVYLVRTCFQKVVPLLRAS